MHKETVEIYSDATNQAVMRHPARKFPGVLIQGDSLHALCVKADTVCSEGRDALSPDGYSEMNSIRNALWEMLNHYAAVLGEHDIPVPYSNKPDL